MVYDATEPTTGPTTGLVPFSNLVVWLEEV